MESPSSGAATQRRYDAFVMTGDIMIIKTTSTKSLPAPQLKSPNTGTCSFESSDDNPASGVNSRQSPRKQSKSKKGALNGTDKHTNNESVGDAASLPSTFSPRRVERFQETRFELDIPPDDISSDDERYKMEAIDIDLDALPPPPDEFLSEAGGECTGVRFVSADDCIDVVTGECVTEQLPSAVNVFLPSQDWRNSLDEAIARLENELPTKFVSEPLSVATDHESKVSMPVCRSTDKIAGGKTRQATMSKPIGGVRSTKSQENCLQFGSDNAQFINIDVSDANSTSVEVLHYDNSVSSSLDSIGQVRSHHVTARSARQTGVKAACQNQNTATSPWWEAADSSQIANDNIVNSQESSVKNSNSQMQECYLVCPKMAAVAASSNVIDNCNTHNSPSKAGVVQETDLDAVLNEVDDVNSTSSACEATADLGLRGIEDICRPQQLKEVDLPSAGRLAKRLYHLDGFRKSDVAKHLSKMNEFSFHVGEEYIRYFDFTGLLLDGALRVFLRKLVLTGETQERERILAHFSRRYIECNPNIYNSEDACHTLTCAIMLLNSDLHRQNAGRRMNVNEFIDNLADLNDGVNFARDLLVNIYRSIRDEPIEFELEEEDLDDVSQPATASIQPEKLTLGIGNNPFLNIPDASKTVEFKKGYVMRKCCADPDGRKTALGRRGWKMFYAALCDMILYLHKDERSYKQGSMINSVSNAVHIHHSLAARATDYVKKQHVFSLQTADWSHYLFQTSNSEDCQKWIDTINYAAASLSAPPLPGACGSQKKFQRSLMPSSYTRLNMKDQLMQHQSYLNQLETDLADHIKYPPERGAKSRVILDYIEKETYLQFEQRRFKTYCLVLHTRMYSSQVPTDLVSNNEPTSILDSPIGEVDDEFSPGSPSRVADRKSFVTSSGAVERSTSDRYSYHAAINQQQQTGY